LDFRFEICDYLCRTFIFKQNIERHIMGRGDAKTKRGKITRGSHGNSRPKLKKLKTLQKNEAKATAAAA